MFNGGCRRAFFAAGLRFAFEARPRAAFAPPLREAAGRVVRGFVAFAFAFFVFFFAVLLVARDRLRAGAFAFVAFLATVFRFDAALPEVDFPAFFFAAAFFDVPLAVMTFSGAA
jgi:hypothetical protein